MCLKYGIMRIIINIALAYDTGVISKEPLVVHCSTDGEPGELVESVRACVRVCVGGVHMCFCMHVFAYRYIHTYTLHMYNYIPIGARATYTKCSTLCTHTCLTLSKALGNFTLNSLI